MSLATDEQVVTRPNVFLDTVARSMHQLASLKCIIAYFTLVFSIPLIKPVPLPGICYSHMNQFRRSESLLAEAHNIRALTIFDTRLVLLHNSKGVAVTTGATVAAGVGNESVL